MTCRFVPNFALRAIQIVLLVEAIIRGINYMAMPPDASVLSFLAQGSAPLPIWGILFIICGVMGLIGELWMAQTAPSLAWTHRAWPAYIAHIGLMVLFILFAISGFVGVLDRSPIYGFVNPVDLLVFAVAHWVFARRRKHA